MQFYKAVGPGYIREISDIRYGMKNYDNKAKCKCEVKDESYGRIRRNLLIGLKEYII